MFGVDRTCGLSQCSRMKLAMGQGSIGGACWRSSRKCRTISLTNSRLVSQKLFRSSRSSSGVSRSEEKVVMLGVSCLMPEVTRCRCFFAGFVGVAVVVIVVLPKPLGAQLRTSGCRGVGNSDGERNDKNPRPVNRLTG